MVEEFVVAAAQCVQTRFARLGAVEAVLGAFAVACEDVFAAEAFGRKGVAFVYAEADPFFLAHDFIERLFGYVAEQIFGIDEMVAGVYVPVVLDDGVFPAGPVIDAGGRADAAP